MVTGNFVAILKVVDRHIKINLLVVDTRLRASGSNAHLRSHLLSFARRVAPVDGGIH
jgi:hypothetical protein